MNTLVVNTYAGSLLIGANAIKGANVIGSFEDVGFGSANTKANVATFPELSPDFSFVDRYADWPDLDLTHAIVLAHPPCAAFSQQNTSAAKRGINTDAFECTRKVLKYAMTNGAAGIAVESVMGALAGAWDVHEHMAEAGGYHLYRVVKNSILFGVPQYRERFWAVFVRKGLTDPNMTWRLAPKLVTIKHVLDPIEGYTALGISADKFIRRLSTEPCICGASHGFDADEVRAVGLAHQTGFKRTGFSALLQPRFFPEEDYRAVCRRHVSPFTSAQPSVLAEGGYSPVLLGSSLWFYRGRPVSKEGYCAIMGFPTGYAFPHDTHYGVRTFLSKGVCPPVATWILDNLRQHVFGLGPGSPLTTNPSYEKMCVPGSIVSFRPGRTTILERLEQMLKYGMTEDDEPLSLRNEEDALMEDDDEGDGSGSHVSA